MAKDVKVQIVGDASKYKAALAEAESASDKFASKTKSAADTMSKFGVGALAVAGAIGVGLFKTGESASNLGESINAVQVTFGKAAAGILKLGEAAAQSVGLSNTAFNSLAVQFSNFAITVAGKGGDVVGVMKELTGRAGDFASVMNIEVADAATLFQSGLAGETEPLRKYGIDLSAAAVSAFAAANGIGKMGEQLTEAEKVQARYGLLMKSTIKDQGDFANTSDSAANSMRIAKAEMENASASIGASFAPAMAFAASSIAGLVGGFANLNDATGGWLGKAAGIGAIAIGAAGALSLVIGQTMKMSTRFHEAKDALSTLSSKLHNSEGGLTGFGRAASFSAKALVGVGVAVAGLEILDQITQNAGGAADALNAFIADSAGLKTSKTATEDLLNSWKKMSEKVDQDKGLFSRTMGDIGHAFDQSGENLAHLQAGFDKIMATSPKLAEETVTAMETLAAAAAKGDKAAQGWLEANSLSATKIAGFRSKVDDAAGAMLVLSTETDGAADSQGGLTGFIDKVIVGIKDEQKAADDLKSGMDNLTKAIIDEYNAQHEATQAAIDAIAGTGDLEQSIRDVASGYYDLTLKIGENDKTQASSKITDEEKAQSQRDLETAVHNHAGEVFALAEKYGTETGAAKGSKEQHDRMLDALKQNKAQYPELAAEIQKYIDKLYAIPTSVTTNVGFGGNVALALGHGVPGGAEGGIVKASPGGTLVNVAEAGHDEALVPLDGKHGLGGGGTHIENLTIQMPVGTNGNDIVRTLEKWRRRNGNAQWMVPAGGISGGTP